MPISVDETACTYEALVTGTRDYMRKCGFSRVLIGLSGGIDSALTACHRCGSCRKRECPRDWQCQGPFPRTIVSGMRRRWRSGFKSRSTLFRSLPLTRRCCGHSVRYSRAASPDVTEENIQARLRGMVLMAMSNKFSALVLTTGNKSEIAVGYCTLYGDMCGGLAVISDVPKTMVYELCREANRRLNNADSGSGVC